MKKTINWIKGTKLAKWIGGTKAWKHIRSEAIDVKRWAVKTSITWAFKIVAWSRNHAQENYDSNVVELYKGVRRREAFVFKVKVANLGKGLKHQKLLLIETPHGMVRAQIIAEDHPEYFTHDYVNKG